MKEPDDKSKSLLQWIYKMEPIQLTANIRQLLEQVATRKNE